MLTFDPTTTSGAALADLFRTWCKLRGDDPEGEVAGCDMMNALQATFKDLGLDVGGPVTQLEVPAGHRVFTVIGLDCDHSDTLYVAHVMPGEYAHAGVELETSEEHFGRWADTFTASSADAAAEMARRQVEGGDPGGNADRILIPTEPEDDETIPHGYPSELVGALRDALTDWFEGHTEYARPRAVSFHVTFDYEDGPAWSEYDPTLHYDGAPVREEQSAISFHRTLVAEALVELDEWWRPDGGDRLRIALPTN
ncbi:hypothetical protein [Streptomyces sp. NPDC047525]|uniref:hypothetical protein n=1 Tax=Streptomyces sp. NPDC047525 TaxID=3155264 RepID=UPI0033D98725